MKRRDFLKTTVLGGAALAVPQWCKAKEARPGQPNIVLVMADDLGTEGLGCYGGLDYQTPNLDALAREGVRFSHCYSQPLCTPSRVQIMTGRYNQRNYTMFGYLDPREITFANVLRQRGYRTCIAGKWQLSGDAATVDGFGFDELCLWNMHAYHGGDDTPDAKEPKTARQRYQAPVLYENGRWRAYGPDRYGPDVCCDFINRFIEKNRSTPFLVYYPMILTHAPFVPTPQSADQSEEDSKKNFVDMVEYMDALVGRIVAHLEKLGLRDNTLLLFTGDNGTHRKLVSRTAHGTVRGGKGDMTDAGTHVPLVAHWPGRTPRGVVCDDLIDFSDFLPTLCEAAGAPLPRNRALDGHSFLPQLRGDRGTPREWIFCHFVSKNPNEPTREYVREKRWKLYGDGTLFDLGRDPLERQPLPMPLNGTAAAAKRRLERAFAEVKTG